MQSHVISCRISIGFFNFFGIKVTKVFTAGHRVVADSLRSVFICTPHPATASLRALPECFFLNPLAGMLSLIFGWEAFIPLQIIGFVLLSVGAFTFGEAISLKSCFPSLYPIAKPVSDTEQPLLSRFPSRKRACHCFYMTSFTSESEPASPLAAGAMSPTGVSISLNKFQG
jgi:hypothetical protein